MTVYVLQYFVWFVVCREAYKTRLRFLPDRTISGRALCVFLFFFYVAFISMLRAPSVGNDTGFYSLNYIRIARADSLYDVWQKESKSALVFVTIEYFLGFISDSRQIYIAVFSLITAVGFASFVYKDSVNVWFSCWLYIGMNLFYRSMNTMRQHAAAGIAMNAYLYLTKNPKSLRGWFWFIIAVGIHPSCIVFLPAVFLSRFSERNSVKKVTLYAVVISVIFLLIWTVAYNIFTSIFPGYKHYSLEGVSSHMPEHGNYLLYLLYFAVTFLYTIRKWHSPVSSKYYILTLLGSLCGFMFYQHEMILRCILYYNVTLLCFIPEIISQYPKREHKFLYVFVFIGLFCYATRHLLSGGHAINPYTFFFLED